MTATDTAWTFNAATGLTFPVTGGPTIEPMTFMCVVRRTADGTHGPIGLSADNLNTYGRFLRLNTVADGGISYYDSTVGGLGAAYAPVTNEWTGYLASKSATNVISVRRFTAGAGTPAWSHTENAGTVASATAHTSGRFVIGAIRPNATSSFSFPGQIAMAAIFSRVVTATEAEAMVSNNIFTKSLVDAQSPTHLWSLHYTNIATSIPDLAGSANMESVDGTPALYTAAGTVPWNVNV